MSASTDRSANRAITNPVTMTDDHEQPPKYPSAPHWRPHRQLSALKLKINVNFTCDAHTRVDTQQFQTFEYPLQDSTGSRGYFGYRESVL